MSDGEEGGRIEREQAGQGPGDGGIQTMGAGRVSGDGCNQGREGRG